MARKITITLCLLLSFTILFAQSQDEAYSLFDEGNYHFDESNYEQALSCYLEAVPLYEKLYGVAHVLTGDLFSLIALTHSRMAEYDSAIEWHQKALEIFLMATGKNSQDTAKAYNDLGLAYFNNTEYDNAIKHHQEALKIRRQIFGEQDKTTADSYYNIGIAHDLNGNYSQALVNYSKAFEIRQTLFGNEHHKTLAAQNGIAIVHYLQGNYEKAIIDWKKIAQIYDNINDISNLASTYSNMVGALIELESFDEALSYAEKGLAITTENFGVASTSTAKAYNNVGLCHHRQGNFGQALPNYKSALEIFLAIYGEGHPDTALAFSNIGNCYQGMGDYTNALAHLEQAMAINKNIYGSHPDIARNHQGIGVVYRSMGSYDQALEHFLQAAEINIQFLGENHLSVSANYEEIGKMYFNKADYEKAVEYLRKAADIVEEVLGLESFRMAKLYSQIAQVYEQWGYPDDALDLHLGALDMLKDILGKNHPDTANQYQQLAWFYAGNGDTQLAIQTLEKAYKIYSQTTNYKLVIETCCNILRDAQLFSFNDYPGFIKETIELGINAVEKSRLDLTSLKTDILKEALPLYYYGIQFAVQQDNPKMAFEYSEAIRNRGFLEQLGTETALRLNGVTEAERNEIKSLSSRISIARKELERQDSPDNNEQDAKKRAATVKEIVSAEKELEKLEKKIGKRLPQYTQLRNPQTVKASDAQKWCGKKRAILEYVLLPDVSSPEKNQAAYCIVVTRKRIQVVKLEQNFDYIETINVLRERISRPTTRESQLEKPRNQLYDQLIAPVLPHIKGIDDLIIVPDNILGSLPFDVLRKDSESKDLGQEYSLSFSPSISISMFTDYQEGDRGSSVLAFGGAWYDTSLTADEHRKSFSDDGTTEGQNRGTLQTNLDEVQENDTQREATVQSIIQDGPSEYLAQRNASWQNLPGTLEEIKSLQNEVFKSKKVDINIQEKATEQELKHLSVSGRLKEYTILHLACHGYFNNEIPQLSSILFSEVSQRIPEKSDEDGYLTIPEAALLNLDAEIVCLSACETALGVTKDGDGIIGLTRSFMVSGGRTVGASLWSVDDEATSQFMQLMYKEAQKKGVSYADAYRRVKNQLRKDEEFSHPYYWAAFVIYE